MSTTPDERATRVTSLELFFDLVFVFTVTQLTKVLADEDAGTGLAQVAIVLGLVWWMYGGYAWLTNAVALDRLGHRLLLLGGMAGFLVIALALPGAFDGSGLTFALGYLGVIALHATLFTRATAQGEVWSILQVARYNVAGAVLVLIGGAVGGDVQWVLWGVTAVALWLTPLVDAAEGFVIGSAHFVERHALVIIVAIGESVVVLGTGAEGLPVDASLVIAATLALGLSAALWWTYFSDEGRTDEALEATPHERRPWVALVAFGYWHYFLLLGVIAVAAGLENAIAHPYDPVELEVALRLAAGTALFVAADVAFRRSLGLPRGDARPLAAALSLATIPIGTEIAAVAQVAVLAAILVAALASERARVAAPA